MEPKQYKNYIAGIYLRLSRDDERAGESLSIENQKILVTKYVKEKGWEIKDVYVDDGYSGTNFDRPGVKRLLDDAKAGEINTIVVKDLSRFGRNIFRYKSLLRKRFANCSISCGIHASLKYTLNVYLSQISTPTDRYVVQNIISLSPIDLSIFI